MKRYCGSNPSIQDCLNCPYEDCINEKVSQKSKPSEDVLKRKYQHEANIRNERRANGLCPYCGKRPPSKGYKMCATCRDYYRRKEKEKSRRDGVLPRELLDGVERCSKCGKLLENGHEYKMCDRCLRQARAALDKTPTHNGIKPDTYYGRWNNVFWTKALNQERE